VRSKASLKSFWGGVEAAVTRNWRITFRIDQTEGEIFGLDYEDYT